LNKKILLVSRCAWTLYNFRAGQIRALLQRGHSVIGGGAGGDGYEEKVRELGISFVPLPVDKKGINFLADLILFKTLFQWYLREKPDIVHHFTIKPVIYGSIAARLAKVPRIVNTITGLGYVFIEEISWLRKLVEWQYRLALSLSNVTFFQNREDLALFLKRKIIKLEKAGLLAGSGVDVNFFTPMPASKNKLSATSCSFLFVSRLLKEKGIYELVEATREVKARFPDIKVQLLGKRDERNPTVIPQQHIDIWQSEGLITWLGETEDVRPFIAQADVVVLPSFREGLPRSLLEASAMEKPVITTDTVGCRDVVDH
jgi:glycosyltransferase involved in cell wall biosynthesis